MTSKLETFTDIFSDLDEIADSQPLSLSPVEGTEDIAHKCANENTAASFNKCDIIPHAYISRPAKGTGQYGEFRSVEEIDEKYRNVFSYPFFNLVQSRVIDDALYSDKSMVVCAPTGSGKTVVFEMAIVHLLMELEHKNENNDFKIIYMAPVKALCTERLTEWYPKFTKLGLLCIEVTGDTDVDFSQLNPYRIIITTPEKWDMLTRRWRDRRQLVEVIKLFLIDEVHILNDSTRGPVLEAVVSRMKTIETSAQSTHRIEQLQQQYQGGVSTTSVAPNIRFVAVSATVNNPEDVAAWLGSTDKPAVYYKFGDECRPVKLRRVVEGYPCAEGTSIFKFDIILNYKLWPIIQKYYNGKPTLIFCNTRKSVEMTAETLSREITVTFNPEQKMKLTALASKTKNKKLQSLIMSGVGCHHAGLLFEERSNIEQAFRNRDLPILITTTTLAMGVNLPAHLVIIKNTQQYVSGAYQEYSISTILQMVGRAGRPQFDSEATAVIMTRLADKPRYQALVGGSEPLHSYLHKRLPENLNSEAALGTVNDVAQCVQWLQSTFLSVRAAKDPKRYLGLPQAAPQSQITKKIEELCVKAMNGLASAGLITMDDACCIESTEAGRLMSIYYLDLETMKHIMKIDGSETLERMLWLVCESHELSDMHLRIDERRILNALNRNNAAATIRFPMKGKINTRQMKLNCIIQAILGCLPIPDPSLNQEAMRIMRIANRVCKCLVAYVTRPALISQQPKFYSAVLNTIILAKCIQANLWENSPYVSRQLKGIGTAFSTLLATAGKVNFMLLEESHPRDLERIMNKAAPAGNILRKQISLYPKYQLTMTPIDEKVVSIRLVLLNQNSLSGNMEHLTAGSSHKSYVIVGDSENTLLLLNSFTDKDLICMYDGSITYHITRKYGFEHKINAHCISSIVAGIDAQCEYVFKNLETVKCPPSSHDEEITTKTTKKQTTITDTFKQRKRKSTENEVSQSKEKKKRESALFEKFKNLKESFGKTSKVLKDDLDKSTVISEKILHDLTHTDLTPHPKDERNEPVKSEESAIYEINDDDFIGEDFIDDDKINNILNEIECEISKAKSVESTNSSSTGVNTRHVPLLAKSVNTNAALFSSQAQNNETIVNSRKCSKKYKPKRSNYNFIDLLEKNVDLSDDEVEKEQNSFSDTIKTHLDNYLLKAQDNVKTPDTISSNLIYEDKSTFKDIEPDCKNMEPDEVRNQPLLKLTYDQGLISNMANEFTNNIKQQKSGIDNNTTPVNSEYIKAVKSVHVEPISPQIDCATLTSVKYIEEKVSSLTVNDQRALKNVLDNAHINLETTRSNYLKLDESETRKCNHSINTSTPIDSPMTIDLTAPDPTNNEVGFNETEEFPAVELKNFDYKNQEIIPVMSNNILAISNSSPISENSSHMKDIPIALSETVHLIGNLERKVKQDLPENATSTDIVVEVVVSKVPNNGNQSQELSEQDNNIQSSIDLPHNKDISDIKVVPEPVQTNLLMSSADSEKMIEQDKPITFGFIKLAQPYSSKLLIPSSNSYQQSLETYNMYPFKSQQPSEVKGTEPAENKTASAQNVAINLAFGNQLASHAQQHDYDCTDLPLDMLRSHNQISEENMEVNTCSAKHNIEDSSNSMNVLNREIISYYDRATTSAFDQLVSRQKCNPTVLASSLYPTLEEIEKKRYQCETPKCQNITRTLPCYSSKTSNSNNSPTFGQQNNDGSNYCKPNNQNVHVNKYSLRSNQVNVSTKECKDHVVRVIRKLRIDMDVTEIISEETKSKENNKHLHNVEELPNEKEDTFNDNNSLTNSNLRCLNTEKENKAMLQICRPQAETNKSADYKLPKVQSPKTIHGTISTINSVSNEYPRQNKIDNRGDSGDENICSGHELVDCSEEIKPNSVDSILQKYSSIMRYNTRHAELNQSQIKVVEKESNTSKKDKPKRPFKISDIHHLNPQLPGALIEKPVNVTECFNMLKHKEQPLIQNGVINSQVFATCSRTAPVINDYNAEEVLQDKYILETIEDLPDSSYVKDLEMQDNISNIDQAMFDPKTLIQYCNISNDEGPDIVPPPPEFRDDNLNATLDVTPLTDCYEPMLTDEEEIGYLTCEDTHNRSIFEDHSQVELTPSKEIETWNLPENEEVDKKYTFTSALDINPSSFTIMRKNKCTVRENNQLKNLAKPRLNKLAPFRYNHKKKFILRL